MAVWARILIAVYLMKASMHGIWCVSFVYANQCHAGHLLSLLLTSIIRFAFAHMQHLMTEAVQKGEQVRQSWPPMFIATPLDLIGQDKV